MQLYVSSSHLPENVPVPPPSHERVALFDIERSELASMDRFAGMGAAFELASGRLEGELSAFLSLRETISEGADQLQSASRSLIELRVPEIALLGRLVQCGIFVDAQNRTVSLSKLHEGEESGLPLEGLAIRRGLQVAQSLAWLSLDGAKRNFELYNMYPASPMIHLGLNPPANQDVTNPALRPVTAPLSA